MTTDTEKRLAEIRERAEKATKGDWYTVGQPWLSSDTSTWVIAGSPDPHAGKAVCEPIISDCFEGEDDQDLERQEQDAMWQAELDMVFIAHARSDIPFLLAEIERLKVDLDRYRYAVSWASADAWDGGKEIRQRFEWARDMDRREPFTENEIAAIGQSYLRTKP